MSDTNHYLNYLLKKTMPFLIDLLTDLNARATMKSQEIDSMLKYSLDTDLEVFDQHKRISFFIRKPYVGELEYDLEFERLDKKIINACCVILCRKDSGLNKISLTEHSYEKQQSRSRSFLDKGATISFFESIYPCFFDGLHLYASDLDVDDKGFFK